MSWEQTMYFKLFLMYNQPLYHNQWRRKQFWIRGTHSVILLKIWFSASEILYVCPFCFSLVLLPLIIVCTYIASKRKNSYRIRIKVRWCIDSSLQKIFWKFIQHTHSQTLAHFRRLPHTPMHTCTYRTHPRTQAQTRTLPCTCMYTCTHMLTPVHTCTHTHTRAHAHTPHTYLLMPLTW